MALPPPLSHHLYDRAVIYQIPTPPKHLLILQQFVGGGLANPLLPPLVVPQDRRVRPKQHEQGGCNTAEHGPVGLRLQDAERDVLAELEREDTVLLRHGVHRATHHACGEH
eukprot:2097539-Pyramimonas_sp.AAC.1